MAWPRVVAVVLALTAAFAGCLGVPPDDDPDTVYPCRGDEDCVAGWACVAGRCSPGCASNDACAGSAAGPVCIDGACSPRPGIGGPCDGHDDCPAGAVCDDTVCRIPAGGVCSENASCAGACIAHVCTGRASRGGECDDGDDADCLPDLVCVERTCR